MEPDAPVGRARPGLGFDDCVDASAELLELAERLGVRRGAVVGQLGERSVGPLPDPLDEVRDESRMPLPESGSPVVDALHDRQCAVVGSALGGLGQ